ncbi:hypothetical protein O5264_28455, partial [Escherichia coli]|nr:hypothetical protein [Escherichia coli]
GEKIVASWIALTVIVTSIGLLLLYFALPTLAGNICGGTFIFALMSHAEDVARYAERLQVVDRNLARLIETNQNGNWLDVTVGADMLLNQN